MDAELSNPLRIWEEIEDCEIIPGDQIGQTLSRTTRQVPCLLKPGGIDGLRQIVARAKENRIPIYPISRGKNWGYGAHLPVKDGSTIVSLERLRKIGPCVPESNKIYVQPGVSQEDLYNYLETNYPQFTFNVTAGGSDTSILGNCLERGIGYYRSRAHELHGLQVLTINGDFIQRNPELWHPSHPEGIGAGWESLFFQSNYGIVTGGWFTLIPKQDSGIFISLLNKNLDTLIDDFRTLYRNHVLDEITHIGDPGRKEYVLKGLIAKKFPKLSKDQIAKIIQQHGSAAFQGVTAIHGRKGINKARVKEIKKLIAPTTKLIAFTPKTVSKIAKVSRWTPFSYLRNLGIFLESVGELLKLSEGEPSNIGHLSIKMQGDDPNLAEESAVYLNATLPNDRNATVELKKLLDLARYRYSITYIVDTEQSVSAIITLHFENESDTPINEALGHLTKVLIAKGFPPYRAGIDQMEHIHLPSINQELKNFFDPLDLIAPGRYL